MAGETLPSLIEVMDKLLGRDGCPWDREQTLESLKAYLLEETYELLEAIDHGEPGHHMEELGDVLFQVVFQSALTKAQKGFDIDDVIRAIRDKLVRRHPHIYADAKVETAQEQAELWERIKAEERNKSGTASGALSGVPAALPGLLRAKRLGEKAGAVGFDWPSPRRALDKVREEVGELAEALDASDRAAAKREIGDLLFATAQLARHLEAEPEDCLRETIRTFTRRFEHVERKLAEAGKTTRESTLDEMEALWEEAKGSEH